MGNIVICNLRKNKIINPWDIKVCRGKSPLGNPFLLEKESQRDLVCDKYGAWLQKRIASSDTFIVSEIIRLANIYEQFGKLRLFCWCAPKRCHAETIKKIIMEKS